jgi:chromosome segregation ATPase
VSQPDADLDCIVPQSLEAQSSPLASGEQNLALTLADYQAVLDDLAQAQTLDQERVDRIYHLEQALDQALACLDELRVQLQEQYILETQLAATEEFAQVQQQAIARLKLQLAEQQQALDLQTVETQQRDQAIQELLQSIEGITQAQQKEVERLRLRIAQDQLENQTQRQRLNKQIQDLQNALDSRQQRVVELESVTLTARSLSATLQGQLEIAQEQIHELSVHLCQQETSYAHLESQLERVQASLVEQQQRIAAWQQTIVPQTRVIQSSAQSDLEAARRQIGELESQLTQHTIQQSRWQQRNQELETERDRLQGRVTELEEQMAEMQEQILHQAQQATEYETAVQYWKDRYHRSHNQQSHLKSLVQQLLNHHAADPTIPVPEDLLNALQAAATQINEPSTLPMSRLTTVELPEFLVKRRSQTMEDGTRI